MTTTQTTSPNLYRLVSLREDYPEGECWAWMESAERRCAKPADGGHLCPRHVKTAQAKLDRLPLSYFDRQPRGELLSRVTNDIDNVATSLQQTLSQLLSNLLTLVGVLFMMFWVSPVLAVIALIAVPVSLVAAMTIGKRAQGRFAAMWKSTGDLNAQIEEAYTGHALVKVFGRSRWSRRHEAPARSPPARSSRATSTISWPTSCPSPWP